MTGQQIALFRLAIPNGQPGGWRWFVAPAKKLDNINLVMKAVNIHY